MTRESASQQGATQQDDDQEEIPQHFEEVIYWFDDIEENIPYLELEQQDHNQERDHEVTTVPNQQNDKHYDQETEEEDAPEGFQWGVYTKPQTLSGRRGRMKPETRKSSRFGLKNDLNPPFKPPL